MSIRAGMLLVKLAVTKNVRIYLVFIYNASYLTKLLENRTKLNCIMQPYLFVFLFFIKSHIGCLFAKLGTLFSIELNIHTDHFIKISVICTFSCKCLLFWNIKDPVKHDQFNCADNTYSVKLMFCF